MRNIGVGTWSCSDRERELVNQVLDSGRLSYGPMSREFESQFSALHGCKYGVLSNSGTSSLQVALQTLKEMFGWEDGTPVAVPAVTFVATVNIVLHNKMKPVLIDVEPDYYGMDISSLEERNGEFAVIMPVHLFGMPCDMATLDDIIFYWRHKNFPYPWVISDSCETMMANHFDSPIGRWGDIACFSTYMAHLITSGVGGIAITDHHGFAAKMRSLVNHGRDGIYLNIDDDDKHSEEVVSRRFNFESVGHSFRVTELEAAIALAQLETWEDMIYARRRNASHLTSLLSDLADRIQLPAIRPHTQHSFMMMPLVMRDESKWPICNYLEQHGIETREMMRITDQPCYKGMWEPRDYPVAEWLNHGGWYCGCHQGLELDDMEYISEVIHEWCKVN